MLFSRSVLHGRESDIAMIGWPRHGVDYVRGNDVHPRASAIEHIHRDHQGAEEGLGMSVEMSDRAEQVLIDAVSADELMASTRAIAQWVRLSGTEDEAKAFDWIEGRLRDFGLET